MQLACKVVVTHEIVILQKSAATRVQSLAEVDHTLKELIDADVCPKLLGMIKPDGDLGTLPALHKILVAAVQAAAHCRYQHVPAPCTTPGGRPQIQHIRHAAGMRRHRRLLTEGLGRMSNLCTWLQELQKQCLLLSRKSAGHQRAEKPCAMQVCEVCDLF